MQIVKMPLQRTRHSARMCVILTGTYSNIHMLNLPPLPHKPGERLSLAGLPGASLALCLANLLGSSAKPACIITPDTLTADRLAHELAFFLGDDDAPILQLPDWETLPYDNFSPHRDIISSRLTTLFRLPNLRRGALITPISTLMHRLCPRDFLEQHTFLLRPGDKINIEALRLRLEKSGYRCVPEVNMHGEFAVRGSIIDLYPMGSILPFRIDLFDEDVDTIRTFSPDTQRTIEKVERIELLPAHEFPLNDTAIEYFRQQWRSAFSGNPLNCPMYQDISNGIPAPGLEYYLPLFFKQTATLADYLPADSLLIHIGNTHAQAENFWLEIRERYEQRGHDATRPILLPEKNFIPVERLFQDFRQYPMVQLTKETAIDKKAIDCQCQSLPDISIQARAEKPYHALQNFIAHYPGRILFCVETAGRREVLLQQFASLQIYPVTVNRWQDFYTGDQRLAIITAPLEQGACLNDPDIALITENALSGARIMQRRRRQRDNFADSDAIVRNLTELKMGAPVVHLDHGVGRYQGLQTLDVGGRIAEFLCLTYADDDKLYVPVTALHLVSRYGGADPENAPLNKLGSGQWQKARKKALEAMRDVAAELLDVYAKREASKGYAYETPDGEYATFAAAFPFEETPDQQKAIEDVIADLRSEKPMDRLVCGDVGFGKTEVAMRAAFVAVQNGRQVVVLVPTTLLAGQHYQNFLDRFADWPVRIDMLSRFKSTAEQNALLANLENGKVDIVIGTHRLLQKNIRFRNLGLLIIDEEHRFGVQQKEKLKSLRLNVDILTLTATPIPRTLNMAFGGIRDLSIIATPPARRLSVKTFVQEYQPAAIKEAILREILRGGQVYFLHNDVASIERMAADLQKLIPEARIGTAHGQMRERELEQVMADFYHRRFNVLVCSTIIESGIDVPSANTIVINRADKLGLAQLHQLRGRVGRSHHQAYAWLLIPSRKAITPDAEKRLDAIASLEDLGAGFTLATHDLEIRGAGQLLGEGQSGNIQAIGYSLYMELLARAVKALKNNETIDLEKATPQGAEIDLHIPALIPDDYLADVALRLQFYRRIATTQTSAELDDIQIEMIDRFGLLPLPAKNLFSLALMRQQADKLGIVRLEASTTSGKITFNDKPNIDPRRIIQLIQQRARQYRMEGSTALRFHLPEHIPENRLVMVEQVLTALA